MSVRGVSPGLAGTASMLTPNRPTLENNFSEVSGMVTVTDALAAGKAGRTATANGSPEFGNAHNWATCPAGTTTGLKDLDRELPAVPLGTGQQRGLATRVEHQPHIARGQRVRRRFEADEARLVAQDDDAQQHTGQRTAERARGEKGPQPLQRTARRVGCQGGRREETPFEPAPHRVARLHGGHAGGEDGKSLLPGRYRTHGRRCLPQHLLEAPPRSAGHGAERVLACQAVQAFGKEVVHAGAFMPSRLPLPGSP